MITALLSLLLLAGSPAAPTPAPTPATTASKSTAQEAGTEERKICKREGSTESRLGAKRICLTAKEWELRKKSQG